MALASIRQKRGRVLGLWASIAAIAIGVAVLQWPKWSRGIERMDQLFLGVAAPRHAGQLSRVVDAPAPRQPELVNGLPPGMVLGYFYDPSGAASAVTMLRHYLPVLTGIIPFWYQINANGSITGSTEPAVLKLAQEHNLWTFALVENMAGQPVFGPLLNSPVARHRAIDNLLTLVEANGYDGVNLDWEGIAPEERHQLSTFVAELARTFHQHGYYVTLSVPAETANQPNNSWTGAYNYRALGRSADLLMIMAYDEHYAGGAPGPIASPAWVKEVLNYTISVVPPSKVILGIPGYGYDWSGSGPAAALSYGQAEALAQQYGAPNANHFVYIQDGEVHSVWFDNTSGLLAKIHLVSGYELRGIALWRLGIEDPKIWDFLE
ncbi:MAG: glycosyl hydrolase family 18 protein [Firmicutes bacterium]|nr:glycosyl hydrolase family 18 protein [Bacillota bacterium]